MFVPVIYECKRFGAGRGAYCGIAQVVFQGALGATCLDSITMICYQVNHDSEGTGMSRGGDR